MKNIILIGNGAIAQNFIHHFEKNKIKFTQVNSNDEKKYFTSSDESEKEYIYLCAIPDKNIEDCLNLFQQKNNHSIYVHFSGSLSLSVFPENIKENGCVLHPMQTFPNTENILNLTEVPFTLQCLPVKKDFIETRINYLEINYSHLSLNTPEAYHLMGVFTSNFMVSLISIAEKLGKENGLSDTDSRNLIIPLMKQTLDNLSNNTLYNGLSGPQKRNDTTVIEQHEKFLSEYSESYYTLYRLLNQELKEIIHTHETLK